MALFQLPAIVLRIHPFEDTHLIVSLLSPTLGKTRAIAKGCRRLQSSLGRAVQPLTFVQFQAAEGKNLDSLTQGVVKNAFPKIRGELNRLAHGLHALEWADRLIEEPEPQPKLFFLLLKTLEALEAGENPPGVARVFEAHFLRLLGYAPRLEACARCGAKASAFSFALGGLVCEDCRELDRGSRSLDRETLSCLHAAFDAVMGETLQGSDSSLRAAGEILQKFAEEKCGKTMHGGQLLRQISATAAP